MHVIGATMPIRYSMYNDYTVYLVDGLWNFEHGLILKNLSRRNNLPRGISEF
jgi:hypothetical protein